MLPSQYAWRGLAVFPLTEADTRFKFALFAVGERAEPLGPESGTAPWIPQTETTEFIWVSTDKYRLGKTRRNQKSRAQQSEKCPLEGQRAWKAILKVGRPEADRVLYPRNGRQLRGLAGSYCGHNHLHRAREELTQPVVPPVKENVLPTAKGGVVAANCWICTPATLPATWIAGSAEDGAIGFTTEKATLKARTDSERFPTAVTCPINPLIWGWKGGKVRDTKDQGR